MSDAKEAKGRTDELTKRARQAELASPPSERRTVDTHTGAAHFCRALCSRAAGPATGHWLFSGPHIRKTPSIISSPPCAVAEIGRCLPLRARRRGGLVCRSFRRRRQGGLRVRLPLLGPSPIQTGQGRPALKYKQTIAVPGCRPAADCGGGRGPTDSGAGNGPGQRLRQLCRLDRRCQRMTRATGHA